MHRTGGGSLGSCAASRAALPRESRDTGTAATAADQRQRLFHNQHQFFFFTTNTCFLDVLNSISRYLLLCFPRSTETEAISQSAPEFGRMSRICGLRMSFPNSLQYYTDGGRCHCCRPKEFFFFTKSTCFLDVTLKLNISVLTPVFSTKYKYKRPEEAFSPPPKTLPKALWTHTLPS